MSILSLLYKFGTKLEKTSRAKGSIVIYPKRDRSAPTTKV